MSKCLKVIFLPVFLLFIAVAPCSGEELISPTRTLEDGGERWGSLTVFSEPPELEVYLDGEDIGKAPLWLDKVKTGPHVLTVGPEKAEIYVDEGKPVKIGLFNGSFVSFPEKEKEKEQPLVEAKQPVQAPQVEEARDERRTRDQTMWEMIIGGPARR